MTPHMAMQGDMNMDMGQQGDAGSTMRPMSHHMVVFGHESVFMSHLAMFSVPEHAYQVILEAELTGSDNDPQQIFRQDWEKHPEVAFYTFAPESFVLSDLLPAAGQPPKAATFSGDLWRNHLEQPETQPVEIASGVTVNVKNIVCGRRFDVWCRATIATRVRPVRPRPRGVPCPSDYSPTRFRPIDTGDRHPRVLG